MPDIKDAEFFRQRWHEITGSPEHQRKRIFARTRARFIIVLGLPALVVFAYICHRLGISDPLSAVIGGVLGIISGWWVGTIVARKRVDGAQAL